MFGSLGVPELLIIFAIILVVFGAGKLPQLGKGLGQGISNFRDGLKGEDQAGLITFSHVVVQGSGLTSQFGQVRTALSRPLPPGETALVDGTFAGMMLGESDIGRALVA